MKNIVFFFLLFTNLEASMIKSHQDLKAMAHISHTTIYDITSRVKIDKLAQTLKKFEHYKITLEGHTSPTGNQKHDLLISTQSAQGIKEYLIKNHGINPKRLRVIGFGAKLPLAENKTDYGKALNERVEAIIISNSKNL